MDLPQGRLWAAVLLLGIAIAAAQTANALSPQPVPLNRGISRGKSVQGPQPTPEDLWAKAVRGLKSITLSPQPEPPSARYTPLARRWQPAPQAPLRLYKPVLPAVCGLKAVTLSPQPEPPGGRAHQQAQRFMRWGTVPLVKAPPVTAPLAPPANVPLARAGGRGLNGLTANGSTAAEPSDSVLTVDKAKLKRPHGFLTPQPKPDGVINDGLGLPGTGDREGGYFAACGAGHRFKTVDCDSWSSAPDLAAAGREASSGTCDRNFLSCSFWGQGPRIYRIQVSYVHGQRSKDGQAAYYARARMLSDEDAALPEHQYCWKRVSRASIDQSSAPSVATGAANMACLNADADKQSQSYKNFDIENMQPDQHANGSSSSAAAARNNASNRRGCRCSLPLLLSLAALILSLVALVCGVYGAVTARRLGIGPSDQGVFLTTNPQDVPSGYQAVNLFKGTGYFAKQPDMLYPRSDHKTLPIGNTVYLLGGLTDAVAKEASEGNTTANAAALDPEPLVLDAVVAYDTYSHSSTQLARMPQPRFRFCGAVLNGQLHVVGGMAAWEAADATTHTVSNQVMRYTPSTNKWEILPTRLNHPRGDCCAAAVAGKLYVAGGWTTDYADTLGSVEVFDPAAPAAGWSLTTNLTVPRGDCEAVALDDETFMVIGGVDTSGNFTASVETLDVTVAKPAWKPLASMLKPRGDFAAEALPGGRVVVMGGETSNGTATEFALHDVEEYQASSDRWVPKAPLPEARFRFDTAHVGERVYAFGGHPTCSSKADTSKAECVDVALSTVYGYFDVQYPDAYAVVKQGRSQ